MTYGSEINERGELEIKITEEHLAFLDMLRESGVTNMWGAPAYLEEHLGLSEEDANTVFLHWMKGFAERNQKTI